MLRPTAAGDRYASPIPLSPGYCTLSILFTDATSGVTTYPANRALQVDAPADGGTVTLDFNRATNLPCAYTGFATCPLPPAENRLPVAVEAGDLHVEHRVGGPDRSDEQRIAAGVECRRARREESRRTA